MNSSSPTRRRLYSVVLGTAATTVVVVLVILAVVPFNRTVTVTGAFSLVPPATSQNGTSQNVSWATSGLVQFIWQVPRVPPTVEGRLTVTCYENGTMMYSQPRFAGRGEFAAHSALIYQFSSVGDRINVEWNETYPVSSPILG